MNPSDQTLTSLADAYLVLAKLLRLLEAQGYRAPLSQALDLLHDFLSTEWSPIATRFRGLVPRRYVATAFGRFVRRRVIEERRQSALLVPDVDATVDAEQGSHEMALSESEVRQSLHRLAHAQRQLLVDRYIEERSERELAAARGVTRHDVRQQLVEAIAAFVAVTSGSDRFPIRAARALFAEGLPVEAAAASLGVSVQRLRAGRDAFLESLRKGRV